jgi:hypothetical protein
MRTKMWTKSKVGDIRITGTADQGTVVRAEVRPKGTKTWLPIPVDRVEAAFDAVSAEQLTSLANSPMGDDSLRG